MIYEEKTIETIPVGPLGLVPLKSCTELGKKVNDYLVTWRRERESEHKSTIAFADTREILTSLTLRLRVLDLVRQKELSNHPSVVMICISWLMSATIA